MAERADQGRDLLLAGRFRIVEKLTFSRKWIGIDISTGQKVYILLEHKTESNRSAAYEFRVSRILFTKGNERSFPLCLTLRKKETSIFSASNVPFESLLR